MESLKNILNPAFPATDQQGHSTVLRKETRTCACGKQFDAYIKVVDGKDGTDGEHMCRTCRNHADEERRRQERLALIPEAEENREWDWLTECNLPSRFADKTFENFDSSLQPKAFNLLKTFDLAWDDDNNQCPYSIVLLSPDTYGVGKTHLVAALANQLIETKPKLSIRKDGSFRELPCPAFFTTENNLLSRIRATFNSQDNKATETEEDIYRQLEKIDLLILDDVGKVRPRDYSFLQGVYFRIIDTRYSEEKPIILTTNLSPTELENHIGGACADRLREMCGSNFVLMKGTSYRQRKVSPKKIE